MDGLSSKSWFSWPVVQFENEAHVKNTRCFKEQEKAILPQSNIFFSLYFFNLSVIFHYAL